ncbi:hypothetical protein C7Y68_13280, partial [Paracidovorax avenae]|uniref:RHS domain-containing protein n=1 Tax=Paracidovorax avenae TaxID=80867 RepID=UPI000D215353
AAYYYQCDQIGAPQELTDEQGRIVWGTGCMSRRLRHCSAPRASAPAPMSRTIAPL